MRDGTLLRADVYRPSGSVRVPTLLGRTPYGRSTWGRWIEPERTAAEGWAVVFNDIRGHYGSEGTYDPYRTDFDDGHDVVEWCAEQPWSDGRVGMFGFSTPGYLQLQAAVAEPPHLRAIAPMQTWTAVGRGCTYDPGGAFSLYTQEWSLMQVAADRELVSAARPDAARILERAARGLWEVGRWHQHLPVGELPPLDRDAAPWYYASLEHPDHDAWWSDLDLSGRIGELRMPGLHLVGWFDRFCRSTVANYVAMRASGAGAPQRLVIGPWPHGVPVLTASGDRFFGPRAEVDVRGLVLEWYDRWLRDVENGVEDGPEVRYFLMGADEWHEAASWPIPGSTPTTLYLRSEGAANSSRGDGRLDPDAPDADEHADRYVYDPHDPTPSVPGQMIRPWGSVDQTPIEDRDDVLCYSTAPLEHDVDVVGSVRATIWAVTDGPDTDWIVKLVDVHPDGYVLRLAEGMIRARYRESHAAPTPLEPGRPYRYEVDVGPVGNRFRAGHRIRVEVASSSFPQFDRNMNTGATFGIETVGRSARQAILHDAEHPSSLVVPIVGRAI
jgi:putative CocE/NonD family hydrolase